LERHILNEDAMKIPLKARDEESTRVAVGCSLAMLEEVERMNGTGRHRQASYSKLAYSRSRTMSCWMWL
jgi:hypothetical protein